MSSLTVAPSIPFAVSEPLLKAMSIQRKELTLHTPEKKRAFMMAVFEAALRPLPPTAAHKNRVLVPLSPAGPVEPSSTELGVKRDKPDFVPRHLVEYTVSDIETDEEVEREKSIKRAPPKRGAGDIESLTALFEKAALTFKKP